MITVSLCTARFEPVNFLEDPSSGRKPLHASREHDRHSLTSFPVSRYVTKNLKGCTARGGH